MDMGSVTDTLKLNYHMSDYKFDTILRSKGQDKNCRSYKRAMLYHAIEQARYTRMS